MKKLSLISLLMMAIILCQAQLQFEQVLPLSPAPQNIADFEGVCYSSIAFADVDSDGDPDVLITGLNNSNQRIAKLYSNDGSGNYALVLGTPFDGVYSGSIAFSDVDSDGDPDVLITGSNSSDQQVANLNINDAQVIIHWLQALLLKTLMLAPKRLPTWIIMAIIIC